MGFLNQTDSSLKGWDYVERVLFPVFYGIAVFRVMRMPEKTGDFLGALVWIKFLLICSLVGSIVGLLIFSRKSVISVKNSRDILIPLACSFFFILATTIPSLPEVLRRSYIPAKAQGLFHILGLIIGLIGILISLWGTMTLGRNFSVFIVAKEVVKNGPYRWVRHPIYFGYLLDWVGVGLISGSIAVLVLGSAFYFLIRWRASEEEIRLNQLDQGYKEYRVKTSAGIL
ncbi:MAG: isoprenylcysteine carboxylmethyltransferase family protein [Verrucomicrobiota bacterium]